MVPEDGATSTARHTVGGGGQVLKKGPWTAAEDAILMEYVKKHGEGNWNAVQRNSGLMRCGKSCRLRWANHLRPNLKKGAFTPEEERQIIELHSKFGNKWARMALHLQGRTDNEIKNYWNTRLKRRMRAGLPIYPVDFQQNHHRRHHEPPLQNQTLPFSSSSSSSNHMNTQMFLDPLNYPLLNAPLYFPNSPSGFKLLRDNNGGMAASSLPFFNQGFMSCNHAVNQIPIMEASFNDARLFDSLENELPSIQSSFQAVTPTCSSNTVNDHMIAPSSDGDNAISPYICARGNSGLLEDVLGGSSGALLSSHLVSNESKFVEDDDKGKEKIEHDYSMMEEPENVTLESVFEARDSDKTPLEDSSSGHSSLENGAKSRNDVFEEMNVVDDDFSSWIDFPTGSLQDWYGGSEEKPMDGSNGNIAEAVNEVEVLCSPVATTPTETETETDHDWTLGSCCWNNMPGFS